MRRRGRWLVVYPGVYGEVRVAREFDDYDEAEDYASELASLIRVYQGLGHLSELHVGDARWIEIQLND